MTEPEPLLSVECHCRCNCAPRPNRRITCELCNWGAGPGCCARNAEGGTPDIGATTCICHVCLTEGPPPQPNPQEEKNVVETQVGIEKELNLADEWEIYDVTNREAAYGHSLEDTRWVIRFDAEDGSSVIVQPNDLEAIERLA